MQNYGEYIRKAREQKGLTFDKISSDTTIPVKYLEWIETEQIQEFPGEPYFLGYLRNYCDYLEIDSNEAVRLYFAKKMQEAQVPTELLEKKDIKKIIIASVSGGVAFILILVLILVFAVFKVPQKKRAKMELMDDASKIHQYKLTTKAESRRVYAGDQILLPDETGDIVLTIRDTVDKLSLDTPAGTQIVDLGEERELDIDGDGVSEFIVYVSDISFTKDNYGAEVRFTLKNSDLISDEKDILAQQEVTEAAKDASVIKTSGTRTIILEDTRVYPFTLRIQFRGACLFRYRVDNQPNYEDYFKSGDLVNITANNGFRLWMSNINALKIQVVAANQTYDLEVGKAGQVQVEDIKWVRESDGKYKLVVQEVK